jgi:hypothetical protein
MSRVHQGISTGYDSGHGKFFRSRLLTMDSESISEMVDQMEKDTNNIRQEALKITWYMRGGVSYEAALNLSSAERALINDIIKENLETTKKSGLPFF